MELPRVTGMHKAKELAFLAEVISASEAERMGIVNRVVPAGELDDAVDTDGPPALADGADRAHAAQAPPRPGVHGHLRRGGRGRGRAAAQAVNLSSDDAREAVKAFMEKRDPNFSGE